MLEQNVADNKELPPRKEPEKRLQISRAFYELRVNSIRSKRYRKEEVIGEKFYYNTCDI